MRMTERLCGVGILKSPALAWVSQVPPWVAVWVFSWVVVLLQFPVGGSSLQFCAHVFPVAGERVDLKGQMASRARVSSVVVVVLLAAAGVQVAQAAVVVGYRYQALAGKMFLASCLLPSLWQSL